MEQWGEEGDDEGDEEHPPAMPRPGYRMINGVPVLPAPRPIGEGDDDKQPQNPSQFIRRMPAGTDPRGMQSVPVPPWNADQGAGSQPWAPGQTPYRPNQFGGRNVMVRTPNGDLIPYDQWVQSRGPAFNNRFPRAGPHQPYPYFAQRGGYRGGPVPMRGQPGGLYPGGYGGYPMGMPRMMVVVGPNGQRMAMPFGPPRAGSVPALPRRTSAGDAVAAQRNAALGFDAAATKELAQQLAAAAMAPTTSL